MVKKITVITNGTLPVPAVKGGAAETLLQSFIDINEKSGDFKLVVFTISDYRAVELSKSYQNTKFIFIKSDTVLFKLGRGIRFIINNVRLNTVKNQFLYEVLKFKKIIKASDLVLIENNPNFAPYVRKVTSKPLGLHLHNDYLNITHSDSSRNILSNLDFVIGVSKYICNRVHEIAPDRCKVDFVYNGVNLNKFRNNHLKNNINTLRERYRIGKDEIIILFTGRLQESKGIKLLMESFIEIAYKYKVKLLIVGSSGFEDSKKNIFIKELESLSQLVPDKIVFTGYIKNADIQSVYAIADFAVLPSLNEEALGLTVVEALASGLPVVVTDAGGMPEAVTETCGFVINRDSSLKENLVQRMKQLIEDKELRKIMGMAGQKRSLMFSDQKYYQSLSDYLKAVN